MQFRSSCSHKAGLRLTLLAAFALVAGAGSPHPVIAWPTPIPASEAQQAIKLDATYTDPGGFYSVRYPKSWRLNQARSEMQFLADKNGVSGFAISLQIKAVSPEALVSDISKLLAGKRTDYEEIDQGETEIDDLPAAWIEYRYQENGAAYGGMLVGVVRNRIGFLLIAWAPQKEQRKIEPIFEAFADSLRIERFDEAPGYEDWLDYDSAHFTYHYLPKTYVAKSIKAIAKDHEKAYTSILKSLGVKFNGTIDMYFYPSGESLYRATARDSGFAINEHNEVHAVWVSAQEHQSVGHEMTHVITSGAIGEPREALLGEGIAVCLDQAKPNPHVRAAGLQQQKKLVPLSSLLGDAFFEVDAEVRYAQSGSIACWLVEQYGADKFKSLYVTDDFQRGLSNLYWLDLKTLEQKWLASLDSGNL